MGDGRRHFKVNQLNLKDLVFIAYGDSGWANAPNSKSQGGLVVLASEKKCLDEPYLQTSADLTVNFGSRGNIIGQSSRHGQLPGMRLQ